MEEAGSEEPCYRGSEHSPPSPSESLHNRDDVRNGEKDSSAELDSEGSPTLVGDPDLIEGAKSLCAKYASVLSASLNAQPALLPSMLLKVDENVWKVNSNRGAARHQTDTKQSEINRQVSQMLEIGVIRRSQAEFYSQVHLTPKPNKAWRFCIDYRALNTASQGMGWPIPN